MRERSEPERMAHKSTIRQADCPGRLDNIKRAPHESERFSLERRHIEKPPKCLINTQPKQEVLHAELLDDVIAEQSEALFVPHDGT